MALAEQLTTAETDVLILAKDIPNDHRCTNVLELPSLPLGTYIYLNGGHLRPLFSQMLTIGELFEVTYRDGRTSVFGQIDGKAVAATMIQKDSITLLADMMHQQLTSHAFTRLDAPIEVVFETWVDCKMKNLSLFEEEDMIEDARHDLFFHLNQTFAMQRFGNTIKNSHNEDEKIEKLLGGCQRVLGSPIISEHQFGLLIEKTHEQLDIMEWWFTSEGAAQNEEAISTIARDIHFERLENDKDYFPSWAEDRRNWYLAIRRLYPKGSVTPAENKSS